jgi:hypothetical protein
VLLIHLRSSSHVCTSVVYQFMTAAKVLKYKYKYKHKYKYKY